MARPKIEITDEQIRQAEILAGYGLTQNQIADVLGVARSTFRRKKDEARVLSALQKGKAVAQLRVGKSIYEKALVGDMTAAIWWEKTRAGRNEKTVQEHTGRDGGPIEQKVEHTDSAQRQQRFDDLFGQLDAYRVGYDDRDREGDSGEPIYSDSPNGEATQIPGEA